MSGKYSSPFDELLASNKKQMDDVLGGSSSTFSRRPATAPAAAPQATPLSEDAETVSGTANGIPFQLKV